MVHLYLFSFAVGGKGRGSWRHFQMQRLQKAMRTDLALQASMSMK